MSSTETIRNQEKANQEDTDMTEQEQFDILATDGMLVKRPIVVGDDFVLVGFKVKEWEEKLL